MSCVPTVYVLNIEKNNGYHVIIPDANQNTMPPIAMTVAPSHPNTSHSMDFSPFLYISILAFPLYPDPFLYDCQSLLSYLYRPVRRRRTRHIGRCLLRTPTTNAGILRRWRRRRFLTLEAQGLEPLARERQAPRFITSHDTGHCAGWRGVSSTFGVLRGWMLYALRVQVGVCFSCCNCSLFL